MQIIEEVSHEQGDLRQGKQCMDQISAIKSLVEECLEKDGKLRASFMDFLDTIWTLKCRKLHILYKGGTNGISESDNEGIL